MRTCVASRTSTRCSASISGTLATSTRKGPGSWTVSSTTWPARPSWPTTTPRSVLRRSRWWGSRNPRSRTIWGMNQKLFETRIQRLRDATLVAIFRTRRPEHAVEGIGAAVRGGFEAVEITLNTPDATDAIAEVAGRVDAIVGAGTVLGPGQVKEAYDAGAEFVVTPVVLPEVVEAAHALSVPTIIGAATPS